MSDAEREYDQLIKNMENEVLALKTAHQRPLGALNFFKKSLDFNVNLTESYGIYVATFNVVVNIAAPEVRPPIVQSGWDTPAGFFYIEYLDFSNNSNYSTWSYKFRVLTQDATSSATIKFGAVSSQPINSITWSYA